MCTRHASRARRGRRLRNAREGEAMLDSWCLRVKQYGPSPLRYWPCVCWAAHRGGFGGCCETPDSVWRGGITIHSECAVVCCTEYLLSTIVQALQALQALHCPHVHGASCGTIKVGSRRDSGIAGISWLADPSPAVDVGSFPSRLRGFYPVRAHLPLKASHLDLPHLHPLQAFTAQPPPLRPQ